MLKFILLVSLLAPLSQPIAAGEYQFSNLIRCTNFISEMRIQKRSVHGSADLKALVRTISKDVIVPNAQIAAWTGGAPDAANPSRYQISKLTDVARLAVAYNEFAKTQRHAPAIADVDAFVKILDERFRASADGTIGGDVIMRDLLKTVNDACVLLLDNVH